MKKILVGIITGFLLTVASYAAGPEVMLKATTDTLGNSISYPEGQAEITGVMVTVPPGGSNKWHSHPVPTFGYQLSGELTVEYENGETRVFKAGDMIIEAQHTPHRSTNTGSEPVQIIVFYAGAEGQPYTVQGK